MNQKIKVAIVYIRTAVKSLTFTNFNLKYKNKIIYAKQALKMMKATWKDNNVTERKHQSLC